MTGNGHSGGGSYRGAKDENDAFEACHVLVRDALRTSVFAWSSAAALNYQRKHGTAATVEWLRRGDDATIRSKWAPGVKSPCISCRVRPLYT